MQSTDEMSHQTASFLALYKSNPAVAKLAGMNGGAVDKATLARLNLLANPTASFVGSSSQNHDVYSDQQQLLRNLLDTATQAKCANKKSAVEEDDEDPKPRRPLSAYNFYFQAQRQSILDSKPVRPEGKPRRSHGKIGFAELARTIAGRWKAIDDTERKIYDDMASADKARYQAEMDEYKKRQEEKEQMLALAANQTPVALQTQSWSMSMTTPIMQPQAVYSQASAVTDLMDMVSSDVFDTTPTERPLDPAPVAYVTPNINDLAHRMNDDCMDLFINMFRQ
jgi:hypothetical protein